MKQCPQCTRNYEDDSLRFCLEDGAPLRLVGGPPSERDPDATLVYGSRETWRNAPPVEAVEPMPPMPRAHPNAAGQIPGEVVHRASPLHPTSRLLVGGVIAIAVLLLFGAVLAAAFLFRQSQDRRGASGPNLANNDLKESASAPRQDNSASKSSEKATSADGLNPKTSPLQIKATASSVRYSVQSNTYDPANTIDGSQTTAWIEGVDGPGWGEWLRFDFDREINLHRILILPGYFKSQAVWAGNNRISAAAFYFSDGTKRVINFPDRMERQKVDVGSVKTRWVRIELEDFYFGKDPDTAISEVAFEWEL